MVRISTRRSWLLAAAITAGVILFSVAVTAGLSSTPLAPVVAGQATALASSSPSSPGDYLSLSPSPTPSRQPPSVPSIQDGSAAAFVALLAELPLDDNPDSHSGYNRDYFNAWIDANSDGCDTRAEVLLNESVASVTTRATCTVSTGSWYSAYDGQWFLDASKLDIDHFVPLKEAWVSGAYAWDSSTRTQFGNDLGYAASLLAVSASSNRSKSDRDPAGWMPPNRDFACDYVATWVAVKYRWNLNVDGREKSALASILSGCSSLAVAIPQRATIGLVPGGANGAPPPPSGGSGSNDGVTDPNYGTCSAANAAGRGPYISGVDPEYAFYRDGDSDGMVCE